MSGLASKPDETTPMTTSVKSEPARLLAFGDSLTAGYTGQYTGERYEPYARTLSAELGVLINCVLVTT
jgi:hypothetical protein